MDCTIWKGGKSLGILPLKGVSAGGKRLHPLCRLYLLSGKCAERTAPSEKGALEPLPGEGVGLYHRKEGLSPLWRLKLLRGAMVGLQTITLIGVVRELNQV